jgi:hypothetical protein
VDRETRSSILPVRTRYRFSSAAERGPPKPDVDCSIESAGANFVSYLGGARSQVCSAPRPCCGMNLRFTILLSGDTCSAGDKFERAQSSCVIVDIGHDHEFVGVCFRNERIDARTNRVGRADDGAREHAHRLRFFRG